ncbi:MAG: YggS family pyridoxal phosphate-dependent enzyme [Fusobacteriaceae bacterium]
MSIKNNIEEILRDIENISQYPEKVKLIAVTKYSDNSTTEIVLEAGIKNLGENRVQLLEKKHEYFLEKKAEVNWHFIGNLQKNKVKYIAGYVKLIHSVNKFSLAEEINKQGSKLDRVIEGLLEINIAGEESKEGYKLDKLIEEIPEYLKFKNLKIVGLMTMAPYTEDTEVLRTIFKKLKNIKEDLNDQYFKGELKELSMGMSNDYKIALEEGATMIRVGTKIFE